MQLNPARGRKPRSRSRSGGRCHGVYAAQPREGTETLLQNVRHYLFGFHGLCSSTPRGDGNWNKKYPKFQKQLGFMQLNPARGRKLQPEFSMINFTHKGFMQLNPAGGRKLLILFASFRCLIEVYAAQPREGTETFHCSFVISSIYL